MGLSALALGILLFMFDLLFRSTADGGNLFTTAPSGGGAAVLPNASAILTFLGYALGAGLVAVGVVSLLRRSLSLAAPALAAGALFIAGASLLAVGFLGTAERGAQAPVETGLLSPALLATLALILLVIVITALVKPRFLLPLLILAALLMALPDLFGVKFWGPSDVQAGADGSLADDLAGLQGSEFLENGARMDLSASGAASDLSLSPEGAHGLSDTPVFEVEGAAGIRYLRVVVADTYDGKQWTRELEADLMLAVAGLDLPVPALPAGDARQVRITASPLPDRSFGAGHLPGALYQSRVVGGTHMLLDSEAWLFRSDAELDGSYSWRTRSYDFEPSVLEGLEVGRSMDDYLALPRDVPDRVRELARLATGRESSPYRKAVALRDYLKTNYAYDFGFENAPSDREPTDWFLFEDKRGVCANFSNAFVVMARSVGLPARPVAGWAIAPTAELQTVRADQAHQWAEVYFEGAGWVRFDATPAAGALSRTPEPGADGSLTESGQSGAGSGSGDGQDSSGPGLLDPDAPDTGDITPGDLELGSLDPGETDPGELDPGNLDLGALDPSEFEGLDPQLLENGAQMDIGAGGAASGLSLSPQGAHAADQTPVFTIEGAQGISYLRAVVADTYDGRRWTRELTPEEAIIREGQPGQPPGLSSAVVLETRPVEITVRPVEGNNLGPGYLPVALYPSVMYEGPEFTLDSEGWLVTSDVPLDGYTSLNVLHELDPGAVDSLVVGEGLEAYVALPEAVSDRVRQLAEQITHPYGAPYRKAQALRDYLKTNYAYDFDYANTPAALEPTDWFLFEDQRGVCANFSNAFVVMARAIGLPTRPVAGWAIAPTADSQLVLAEQAHQWAEVYFEEAEWVRFDATPSGGPQNRVAEFDPDAPPFPAPPPGGFGGTSTPTPTPTPTPGPTPAPTPTPSGSGLPPLQTMIEVTEIPDRLRKGAEVIVSGILHTTGGGAVDGMGVEVYINLVKENGGILVGTGVSSLGTFTVPIIVPPDAPVGTYHVLARAVPNARFAESWSDPEVGVFAATQIEMTGPTEVPVGAQVLFSGRLNEETGPPVPGKDIRVLVDGALMDTVQTDAAGAYEFTHVFGNPGSHVVEAEFLDVDDFLGNVARLSVSVMLPTVLVVDVPARVEAGQAFRVEGSLVTVNGDPVPIRPIEVFVDGASVGVVPTDDTGAFSPPVTLNPAGGHAVELRFGGETPLGATAFTAVVHAGHPTKMEMSGPSHVVLGDTALIEGRLIGLRTGEPLAGVPVTLEGIGSGLTSQITAQDGTFQVRPVFTIGGAATVSATYDAPGVFWPSTAVVSVKVQEPASLTISGPDFLVATDPYTLSGVLTGPDGSPIPNATVHLQVADQAAADVVTDANGRLRWESRLDGEGALTVGALFDGDDLFSSARAATVVSVGPAVLTVEPVGRVGRGTEVVLQGDLQVGGLRLDDVEVGVSGGPGAAASTRTDSQGRFELRYAIPGGVPLGTQTLTVEAAQFDAASDVPLDVAAPATLTVLAAGDVKPGKDIKVQAHLADDTGAPVAGVDVQGDGAPPATTDDSGVAELVFPAPEGVDPDADSIPVTVSFAGDADRLPAQTSVRLRVTPTSFTWLLWLLLPVVGAIAGAGGVLQWRRMRPQVQVVHAPAVAPVTPVASQEAGATQDAAAVDHAEPVSRQAVPTTLAVSVVKPAPDLPDVWGVGEEVGIEGVLGAADGAALTGKAVGVAVSNSDWSSTETTDDKGAFVGTWTAGEPATYTVDARFEGDEEYAPSVAQREVRVVEFRAEIIRLYNEFLAWAREQDQGITSQATPREVEARLAQEGVVSDSRSLQQAISMFEEAAYSEHEVGRRQYETMFRASRALMGPEA